VESYAPRAEPWSEFAADDFGVAHARTGGAVVGVASSRVVYEPGPE
jgi:hypothetical protein